MQYSGVTVKLGKMCKDCPLTLENKELFNGFDSSVYVRV